MVEEKIRIPVEVAVVRSGVYSASWHGGFERIRILCPACDCARVVEATHPPVPGVRESPRITPVRVAEPSVFCVIPEKEINSETELWGESVPYSISELR